MISSDLYLHISTSTTFLHLLQIFSSLSYLYRRRHHQIPSASAFVLEWTNFLCLDTLGGLPNLFLESIKADIWVSAEMQVCSQLHPISTDAGHICSISFPMKDVVQSCGEELEKTFTKAVLFGTSLHSQQKILQHINLELLGNCCVKYILPMVIVDLPLYI